MLPPTTQRVQKHTAGHVNERITRQTRANLLEIASSGPACIDRRLAELEQEWDVERCLETMAPAISIFGLLLGTTVKRRWLLLPLMVQAFLLQHALQGWCPPLAVLRRLGIRTAQEIDEERFALKAMRGDFRSVPSEQEDPTSRVNAAAIAVHQ